MVHKKVGHATRHGPVLLGDAFTILVFEMAPIFQNTFTSQTLERDIRRRAKCDEGSMRAPRVCLGGGGRERLTPGGRERGAAAKRARRVTCAFWGTTTHSVAKG